MGTDFPSLCTPVTALLPFKLGGISSQPAIILYEKYMSFNASITINEAGNACYENWSQDWKVHLLVHAHGLSHMMHFSSSFSGTTVTKFLLTLKGCVR